MQKAKELGLDVVEVSSNAKPPVAKLIDYKNLNIKKPEKNARAKKTQKNVGIKEIRLRPFIGQHDFDTRLKRANEFLANGNQVKITVLYKGRELGRKQFGFEVLNRFIKALGVVKLVREPRMEGRSLAAMVVHEKKTNVEDENSKASE